MSVLINVSVGELWDKYTILLIKQEVVNCDSLWLVNSEIAALEPIMCGFPYKDNPFFSQLKTVNKCLWDIEDKIREKEAKQQFDGEFVELARHVYFTNDKRAKIKRQINDEFNSVICEVKCYAAYMKEE
jgi:hypothetical protein